MSSISPPASVYPLPPGEAYDSPYKYDDQPSQNQTPRSIANAYNGDHTLDLSPSDSKTKSSNSADTKPRLRKACDSCSVRKVKCDESGPPCKSCAALEIPCTFHRPSRRRGPPNRHAEAIKRQRLDDGSYNNMLAASPTRDAAYSLAALAAPLPLSAESICDIGTLEILLEDYFTYIHPLIPIPHEPTFRAAFERREDRTDRSFLALLAVMIETLVASFPRRPRQLFTSEAAQQQFPNAGALIDRCHQVFNEARGTGFLDRNLNLYDACCSYFAGLAAAYVFDSLRLRLYLGECVMILRTLGFHRPEDPQLQSTAFSANPPDYVYQQVGRRLFWLCFVGAMSIRQLDSNDADIMMPPMSHSESLPAMPVEVDDEYITPSAIFGQPHGIVSLLTGFNFNIRIFRAFHAMTALELAFGTDTLFDWDRQRQVVRRALVNVKNITKEVPSELRLEPENEYGEWPPRTYNLSAYSHLLNGRRDPDADAVGLPPSSDARRGSLSLPYPRRAVQFEIQKANIYATQLATRSYLVEKFWNLYDIHDREKTSPAASLAFDKLSATSSPTVACVAAGIESRFQHNRTGKTPSDSQMDAGEQAMAVEREDIVRDLAILLRSINQVNMEPNGQSFCNKIRQVASTLLNQDRSRMAVMPSLDTESVNEYLFGFCEILAKLERLSPRRLRPGTGSDGGMRTAEDIEEEELVHWASLKEHQERFVMRNEVANL